MMARLRTVAAAAGRGVGLVVHVLGAPFRALATLDRWDVLLLTGAGLLGGGVWGLLGPAWACVLWGGLLLTVAGLHELREGR